MANEFFRPEDLSFEHAKVLASAMFEVARVDGVHDREMAMIREFYEGCSRAGDPPLETVVATRYDAAASKKLFDTPEKAKLFVKSLILLAFADGSYAKVEDELIRRYAKDLGLDDATVSQLHQATKEYLLSSLAHVQNVEALKKVAAELDLH